MDGYDPTAVAVAHGMSKQLREAREKGNELAGLVRQLTAKVKEQREEISKLRGRVAVQEMHIAGLTANRDAYIKQHPDSPLRQASGQTFKDGETKTVGRVIYERAFDEKGRQTSIENPSAHRED